MIRVDPDESEQLIVSTQAQPFEMRGRRLRGWLRVDADAVRTNRQLVPWVRRGITYAGSLPPKL